MLVAGIMETEVEMVTERSGIKDKERLRAYLYKNPTKLALKLAQFIKDSDGNALPLAKIKGKGGGYFYSINDKAFKYAPRSGEYYLLPWEDTEFPEKCYIYGHHAWMVGIIFKVYKDEIEILGDN